MIEIRTDWVNDIEYSWDDFALVLLIQAFAMVGAMGALYLGLRK